MVFKVLSSLAVAQVAAAQILYGARPAVHTAAPVYGAVHRPAAAVHRPAAAVHRPAAAVHRPAAAVHTAAPLYGAVHRPAVHTAAPVYGAVHRPAVHTAAPVYGAVHRPAVHTAAPVVHAAPRVVHAAPVVVEEVVEEVEEDETDYHGDFLSARFDLDMAAWDTDYVRPYAASMATYVYGDFPDKIPQPSGELGWGDFGNILAADSYQYNIKKQEHIIANEYMKEEPDYDAIYDAELGIRAEQYKTSAFLGSLSMLNNPYSNWFNVAYSGFRAVGVEMAENGLHDTLQDFYTGGDVSYDDIYDAERNVRAHEHMLQGEVLWGLANGGHDIDAQLYGLPYVMGGQLFLDAAREGYDAAIDDFYSDPTWENGMAADIAGYGVTSYEGMMLARIGTFMDDMKLFNLGWMMSSQADADAYDLAYDVYYDAYAEAAAAWYGSREPSTRYGVSHY